MGQKRLRPPGDYDFSIVKAEEKKSKAGNDMLELTLMVYDKDGTTFTQMDWIVAAMEWKLRHFAYTIGMSNEYEAGQLDAASLQGRSGKVTLAVEKGRDDGKGGLFPDKNNVKDYCDPTKAKRDENKAITVKPSKADPVSPPAAPAFDDPNSPPF
jgi:hypothetical protein